MPYFSAFPVFFSRPLGRKELSSQESGWYNTKKIESREEEEPVETKIDELTLLRARRGDAEAFESLIQGEEIKIYHVCLGMMRDKEDAKDMAQECFLKAWRGLARFDGRSGLETWLYRIAVNTCLDELRRRKREHTVSAEMLAEEGWEPADDRKDFTDSQAEKAEILDALQQMDEDARTVIILRDMKGLSYEEIAEMLDCPTGTVRSRLNRARKKLGSLLRKGN